MSQGRRVSQERRSSKAELWYRLRFSALCAKLGPSRDPGGRRRGVVTRRREERKSPLPVRLEEVFERNGCREPYYQCA
jgi:hypothetical protein